MQRFMYRAGKRLNEWFNDLCRFFTRAECHEARDQVHETMRWVTTARAHRKTSQRRLDYILDDR
jgi:hypothetical protein